MTGKEKLVLWCIIFCVTFTTLVVIETIEEARAEETKIIEATWSPPPIPRCDKETWDRIREGCDE